ncbi:MAG: hypothetical protein V1721_05760 [Pseudomonadota bacterium]
MRTVAFLAVLFLSGCAMFSPSEEVFSCPETGLVSRASSVVSNGAEARIGGFSGECRFEKNRVEISLTLPFTARKGAADPPLKEEKLSYFIAVLSPEEDILQRRSFSTKIEFDKDGNGGSMEEHVLKIPMANPSEAHRYKVAIGFAQTTDQLKHNKESK